MSNAPPQPAASGGRPLGALEFRMLGPIDFDVCLQLQEHLVRAALHEAHPRIVVLLAEHPRMITVGRRGSRAHVRMSEEQLRRKRIPLRWVSRGGGCVLHGPGQLAIYPIVPLAAAGWSVGDYLERFRGGLVDALEQLGVPTAGFPSTGASDTDCAATESPPAGSRAPGAAMYSAAHGIWGRSGRLAAFGVSVRDWVSFFGAYLNVNPAMADFPYVRLSEVGLAELRLSNEPGSAVAARRGSDDVMGSLLSERRHAGRMTKVRSQLVASLGRAFDSPHYHLYTGHPFVARLPRSHSEPARSL